MSGGLAGSPRKRPGDGSAVGGVPGGATDPGDSGARSEGVSSPTPGSGEKGSGVDSLDLGNDSPTPPPSAPRAADQFANMPISRRDPPARSRIRETRRGRARPERGPISGEWLPRVSGRLSRPCFPISTVSRPCTPELVSSELLAFSTVSGISEPRRHRNDDLKPLKAWKKRGSPRVPKKRIVPGLKFPETIRFLEQ